MRRLPSGTALARYQIVRHVGSGGMGDVYEARDTRIGRAVALKVLPPAFRDDDERLQRFETEARAAGTLNHPNLVTVYDIAEAVPVDAGGNEIGGAIRFIAMELLEGENLRSKLTLRNFDSGPEKKRGHRSGAPLATRKVIDYATQIAKGLVAAHEQRIVHRDLKPENIFITAEGLVKILDFGLAKVEPVHGTNGSTELQLTTPGAVVGTLGYISPEQLRGEPLDGRADLFSFGAILYELLTGQMAFDRGNAADTMMAILREDPPPANVSNSSVEGALHRIARRCLEKSRSERFRTASDLLFALQHVASEPAMVLPREPWRWKPRRTGLFLTVAVIALAPFAAAVMLMRMSASERIYEPPALRTITYSGRDHSPAASARGDAIAFVSMRDGHATIWLKQLSGGNEAALTDGVWDYAPRFTPDGSAVLFTRLIEGRTSLWSVPTLGGEPKRLLADAADGDVAPSGDQIVFVRSRGAQRVATLCIWSTAAGQLHEIAASTTHEFFAPRWSHDGKAIAVVQRSRATLPASIRIFDLEKGTSHELKTAPGTDVLSSVAWSGGTIVYGTSASTATRFGSNAGRFVAQNIRGGEPRTIVTAPSSGSGAIDILPDGRLVFADDITRKNLRELALGDERSEQAEGRWLTRGRSNDRQPFYSPDGASLLFSSDRTGHFDLWRLDLRDGALRRLTDHASHDWDPASTADGKLLWSSERSGHYEIWSAEEDGSGARQLTRDGVDAENPSPAGSLVVYDSSHPQREGLWLLDLTSGRERNLLEGEAAHPELSPDGRLVAYHLPVGDGRQEIRLVRVADGSVSAVATVEGWTVGAGRAKWFPDGKSLAFIDSTPDRRPAIVRIAMEGDRAASTPREVLVTLSKETPIDTFAISPDGRRLTLSLMEESATVIVSDPIDFLKR